MVSISKPRLRTGRSPWRYGALGGLAGATALEAWRQYAMSQVHGEATEGVWLHAADIAVRLGFPINAVMIVMMDVLSPLFIALWIDPFFLLLLGIVLNWALLVAAVGRLFRLLARHRRPVRG
jgi:hypothetical protein